VFYRDDGDGNGFQEEWEDRGNFQAWRVSRSFDAARTDPMALFWDTFRNPDVRRSVDRFLDEVQPDVVHFQHLMLLSHRLIAQAKKRDLPCLLTLHDYWFICSNSQLVWPNAQICKGRALGLNCVRCATARINELWVSIARPVIAPIFQMRDLLVRRAAMQADLLISPSRFLINRYIEEGFPARRFVFLENGLDVNRIRAFKEQKTHSGDDRLRVTYLGSLAWQKGVHILVDAFHELSPKRAVLRVFGSLDTFPEYSADLRERANQSNTIFEGRVPNEHIGRVLAETDVLAVPSLWFENSPVVIQEARAAGVPVIASAHGALIEKVRDGVDGLLVPPGDITAWRETLRRLTREPSLLSKLQSNVRSPVTLEEHVDRLEALYTRVDSSTQAC
jgi:glycosyltransferase involved in cell wall biosynthesis